MWFRMGKSSRADSHCCLYLIARLFFQNHSGCCVVVWNRFFIAHTWLALEWGNAVLQQCLCWAPPEPWGLVSPAQATGLSCPVSHSSQWPEPDATSAGSLYILGKDSYQITWCSGRLLSLQCKPASALQLYSLMLGFGCDTKQFFWDLWRI